MHNFAQRVFLATLLVAAAVPVSAATIVEDFSTLPIGVCQEDGTVIGAWTFVYDGFGCTAVVAPAGNAMLLLQPTAATQPSDTHGSLVVGPAVSGDFAWQTDVATSRQLRTGSAPNAWEVGWVLWHFTDNVHFYYFIPKPNGWELGKADPAYPGAQRFLATGSSPQFPIGGWYRVRVTQAGATIQVYVNDLLITTFTDLQSPYSSGRVGLYTEDAESYFDNVSITTAAGKGKKRR